MHGLYSPFTTPSPPALPSERKLKKPLMEKRRRKRINDSLGWLKDNLIHISPQQRSKLEKADILEMTIEYIKILQQGQHATPHSAEAAYRRGLHDGFSEASKASFDFLNVACPPNTIPGQQIHHGLIRHLSASCHSLVTPIAAGPAVPPQAPPSLLTPSSSSSASSPSPQTVTDGPTSTGNQPVSGNQPAVSGGKRKEPTKSEETASDDVHIDVVGDEELEPSPKKSKTAANEKTVEAEKKLKPIWRPQL